MKTAPFQLLALPREIRDEIYAYHFALPWIDLSGNKLHEPLLIDVSAHIPRSPLGVPSTTLTIPYSMLAPLCKSCKQLYWEATPFYISSCLFSIEDTTTTKFLTGWLDTFGVEGWKAVRHLEFRDFSRVRMGDDVSGIGGGVWEKDAEGWGQEGTDHDMLLKCPNLRTLNIRLVNVSLPPALNHILHNKRESYSYIDPGPRHLSQAAPNRRGNVSRTRRRIYR